jgi:hypothetical protein
MASNLEFQRERAFELVTRGFSYLAKSASRKGHWNEVRSTALAGMCLQLRERADSPWLFGARDWLIGEQEQTDESGANGSWGEEVWDTSMCLIALKDMDVSSHDPVIERGLKWMASIYSANGRDNWHDEPWETSWALIAFLKSGRILPPVELNKAMRWLMSLQTADGRIVSPHYTAYFVLIEFLTFKANLSDEDRTVFRQVRDRCRDYLMKQLEASDQNRLWAGEAWMNGQILWALCVANQFSLHDERQIAKVINWFENAQSPEGNWSDVEDTASAILGLHRLLWLLTNDAMRNEKRAKDIDGLIESRLRKAVRMPRLQIKRRLLERDSETGYVTLSIRENSLKLWLSVLGFIFVGLAGWLANVISLIQSLFH